MLELMGLVGGGDVDGDLPDDFSFDVDRDFPDYRLGCDFVEFEGQLNEVTTQSIVREVPVYIEREIVR